MCWMDVINFVYVVYMHSIYLQNRMTQKLKLKKKKVNRSQTNDTIFFKKLCQQITGFPSDILFP